MNEDQFKKILNDEYDQSREMTFGTIIKDFYNRKMRSIVILVWTMALLFIGLAVICGIMFSKTAGTDIKMLILYATLFLVFAHWVDLMKIFAWQMIHRNSLKREIKRLELRIMELSESVKERS